jgi:hypothetical protein
MSDKTIRFGYFIILGFSLAAFWGCGGGGLGSAVDSVVDSNSMSSAQAESFAKNLSIASSRSLGKSPAKEPEYSESLFLAENQQSDALLKALPLTVPINQSIDFAQTCNSGGTMKSTGRITGSVSDSGTSFISFSVIETVTDWSCQTPLIINGDPYISVTGTFSFLNGVPATQQHIGVNGGIKWGTSSVQSCQIHLDTNFSNNNKTGHTTGTVCGHTIDATYSY